MNLKVAKMLRIEKGRRLLVLRAFVVVEGKLTTFLVRAMMDTGAEGNFISPRMARTIGVKCESGDFGVVLEAFGHQSDIEEEIDEDFDVDTSA